MRRIGLIGGMSWVSTKIYYERLNLEVQGRLGGFSSADLLLHSLDFAPIAAMQQDGAWALAGERLAESARWLERGGAGAIVLCTNTMHAVADAVRAGVSVPLLHIADAVGTEARRLGLGSLTLLGTRFTMSRGFMADRLREAGLVVRTPTPELAGAVDGLIFGPLCRGVVPESAEHLMKRVAQEARGAGSEGLLLACTELGLVFPPCGPGSALTHAVWCELPAIDSAVAHALHAARWMLDDGA